MSGRTIIRSALCLGLATGMALFAAASARAQCGNGYYYGGYYPYGYYRYYSQAPYAYPPAPTANQGGTYQSFSYEPRSSVGSTRQNPSGIAAPVTPYYGNWYYGAGPVSNGGTAGHPSPQSY